MVVEPTNFMPRFLRSADNVSDIAEVVDVWSIIGCFGQKQER